MTTREHLDVVVNYICKGKMTDKPTMVLSSERAQQINLDIEKGVDATRYAREKRAERRDYNQRGIIYGQNETRQISTL